MKKINIVRKNLEIQEIIKKGKKIISPCFVIYYTNNKNKFSRFCISVGKKIGKANERNYYKRVTKNIIDKINVKNNNDYVIILRNSICKKNYSEIFEELNDNLKGKKI